MKFIKKAAAFIISVSLILSLCSCNSNLSWAAKIDDTTVPIGLYIYSIAENYRSSVSNSLINTFQDLDEQTVTVSDSDKKATEYFDSEAEKYIKSYVGAYQMFIDMDLELTEEELDTAIQSASTKYEADKEVFEQNGIAQSSVEEYYKDIARKSKLFLAKYDKDGTEAISDEDLKDFFNKNYASINFIQQYFYNDDGTAMTDKEKETLTNQYKKIQSQAEKGKIKFTDTCKEYSQNATDYKGGYTDSVSRFNTESEDGSKILALKTGEFTLLVTDSTIALVQKATLDKDGSRFEQYRESLLMEYKYSDFINELIKYGENLKNVEFNKKAFEKFSSSTRDFSDITISSSYY